jgi:hypothetical protein
MQAVEGLSKQAGKHQACLALGVPRCAYTLEKSANLPELSLPVRLSLTVLICTSCSRPYVYQA